MNLFGNVFICATKILISKNTFIVWHNWMKIGWCGIFTKKSQMKTMISCHMFQNFLMFIICGKNFPEKSILKVWLLLVQKVSQLVINNSSMSWIHLWARGAPQFFATTAVRLAELVLLVRYELIASRSLTQFLCKIYAFWPFWTSPSYTRYVSYVGIKENLLGLVLRLRKIRIEKYVFFF